MSVSLANLSDGRDIAVVKQTKGKQDAPDLEPFSLQTPRIFSTTFYCTIFWPRTDYLSACLFGNSAERLNPPNPSHPPALPCRGCAVVKALVSR